MRLNAIAVTALLAAEASAATVPKPKCAADNCLRALRATQIPGRLQSAQAFCATFTTTSSASIPTFAAEACKKAANGDLNARLSSACACIAPTTTSATVTASTTRTGSPTYTPPSSLEPCGEVSTSWAAQIKTVPTPTVAAALAYKCLNSVPLGKDAAIALVDSIEPYLEWQSDTAYKKNPPKGYFYPGYDIFGSLAKVRSNLLADKYASEYAFQLDLYTTVFGPGHDGHFVFYPDALTKVIKWMRPHALVSISEDGSSLPVIKLHNDVLSSPGTASTVKLINGVDAAKYVEDTITTVSSNQDVDAAYNTMFYGKAQFAADGTSGYFAGGGRTRFIYQGPNTTFTFDNGTVFSVENQAAVITDMSGVTDGPSFYTKFCVPKDIPPTDPPARKPVNGGGTVPGYPKPVISTGDGIVSGYYLEGKGLEDVAVLSLLAFENQSPAEFHAVSQDFLNEAAAAGKTKLVVDFQSNGGGYILQGYDFFRQLFPQILQDGFSRFKENDAFLAAAKIVSDEVANLNPYTSNDEDAINDYLTWFNYRYDLNLTNGKFLTFEDKFSPQIFENTPYTALMRWDLNDTLSTSNETFGLGFEMTGYGKLTNLPQLFKPENIVIIYDGSCASTCTIASEMLRLQGGVKSVAFGGRPRQGPIQGVGGVKGSQVLQYQDIYSVATRGMSLTKDPKHLKALSRYTALPMQRSIAAAVNARDQVIPENLNDGIPAQFVTENSDCRLYWTAPMIKDVSEIWKATANAAFNGGKCAYGGIDYKGSAESQLEDEIEVPKQRQSELLELKAHIHSPAWRALHRQVAIP